jgi:intracellular sulfur oxidation DsrE/DsrF family protein
VFQEVKLKKILLTLLFAIALFSYNTISPAKAADKMKIVYHVSDLEKVPFVLGNMRNHIKGAGGSDKLDMILVVHGPAGKAFHKSKSNPKVEQRVDNLSIDGVKFNMCGNTMRAQKVKITDLLSGFSRHDEGGVVRIAELQSKGYIYIRP